MLFQTTTGDSRPTAAVSDTIAPVTRALEFWARTTKSARKALEHHIYKSELDMPDPSTIDNDDYRRFILKRIADAREYSRQWVLSASVDELLHAGLIPERASARYVRRFVHDHLEKLTDLHLARFPFGITRTFEERWYAETKVFLSPEQLWEHHPDFDEAWGQILMNGELHPDTRSRVRRSPYASKCRKHSSSVITQVNAHIGHQWKPNITLFVSTTTPSHARTCLYVSLSMKAPKHADRRWYPDEDGYPMLEGDWPQVMAQLDYFNGRNKTPRPQFRRDRETNAWDASCAFFSEAAEALKSLGTRVTVEVICGGLPEVLAKMRFKGDITRPEHFPRSYTRMWLSNVP